MANVPINDFLEGAARVAIGSLMGRQQAEADLASQEQERQQRAAKAQAEALAQQRFNAEQEYRNKELGLRQGEMAWQGLKTSDADLDRQIAEQQKLLTGASPEAARQIQTGITTLQGKKRAGHEAFRKGPYAQYYSLPAEEEAPPPAPAAVPPQTAPAAPPQLAMPRMAMGGNVLTPGEAPTPFPRQAPAEWPATTPGEPPKQQPWLVARGVDASGNVVYDIDRGYTTRLMQGVEQTAKQLQGTRDPKARDLLKRYGSLPQEPRSNEDFEAIHQWKDAAALLPTPTLEEQNLKADRDKHTANVNLGKDLRKSLRGLEALPLTKSQLKALTDYENALPHPDDPKFPAAAEKLNRIIARLEPGAKAARDKQIREEKRRQKLEDAANALRARREDAYERYLRQKEMREEAQAFAQQQQGRSFAEGEKRQRSGFREREKIARQRGAGKGSVGKLNPADRAAIRDIYDQIKQNQPIIHNFMGQQGIDLPNRNYDPAKDRRLHSQLADIFRSRNIDPANYYKQHQEIAPHSAEQPQPGAPRRQPGGPPVLPPVTSQAPPVPKPRGASPRVSAGAPATPPVRRVRAQAAAVPARTAAPVAAATSGKVSPPGRTRVQDGYVPAPLRGMAHEVKNAALYALHTAEGKGMELYVPRDGGVRSNADQTRLKKDQQAHPEKYPFPVAKPGESVHQLGAAMDVTNGKAPTLEGQRALAQVLEPLGWQWAGEKDMVHFNYVGNQKPQTAATPAAPQQPAATRQFTGGVYNFATGKAGWSVPKGADATTIPQVVEAVNKQGDHVWIGGKQGRWYPFRWYNGQFHLTDPRTGGVLSSSTANEIARQGMRSQLAARGYTPAQINAAVAKYLPG